MHHVNRRFLSQEDDFRLRDQFANLPGDFDSVQARKADVQQDQIRLQFLRFPDCFKSIGRKVNDASANIFLELLEYVVPPSGKIVDNEDSGG